MKKIMLLFFVIGIISLTTNAQDYTTGIGIRGGTSNGLTVKHFIGKRSALEGLLATRWEGFNITGLYEMHATAFDTRHLYWYYGFGGHIGFWNGAHNPWFNDHRTYSVVGIDGIIGLEYNIIVIPFNIGLDWKPGLNLIGYSGFWGDELALSVRFTF